MGILDNFHFNMQPDNEMAQSYVGWQKSCKTFFYLVIKLISILDNYFEIFKQ